MNASCLYNVFHTYVISGINCKNVKSNPFIFHSVKVLKRIFACMHESLFKDFIHSNSIETMTRPTKNIVFEG